MAKRATCDFHPQSTSRGAGQPNHRGTGPAASRLSTRIATKGWYAPLGLAMPVWPLPPPPRDRGASNPSTPKIMGVCILDQNLHELPGTNAAFRWKPHETIDFRRIGAGTAMGDTILDFVHEYP